MTPQEIKAGIDARAKSGFKTKDVPANWTSKALFDWISKLQLISPAKPKKR